MRKAVVEVGSNSVLLLVEERRDTLWSPVIETSAVTGLGQGVKKTGILGELPMQRTLDAIRVAFELAQGQACDSIIAAATMAARIAQNTSQFLERADRQGTPVRILPAESEAELGFLSVAEDPLFGSESMINIIDPGGNSTEIVCAERTDRGWNVGFRHSYPVGTLGLRDTLLPHESPSLGERMATLRLLDDTLAQPAPLPNVGQSVVLGATGTNLVTIRERMAEWDPVRVHGATLTDEEVSRAAGWLCDMTDRERSKLVGIEQGREGTIHIGALILDRCLHALKSESCRVSVRGWRHALLESHDPEIWF